MALLWPPNDEGWFHADKAGAKSVLGCSCDVYRKWWIEKWLHLKSGFNLDNVFCIGSKYQYVYVYSGSWVLV